MSNASILTVNLTRTFKRGKKIINALKDVNLGVNRGEIFGLLGPNGAGKTTLIRILATLLLPTSGEAYVEGYDVTKEPGKVRELINVVSGGERAGYGILTLKENLWYFSQLYGFSRKDGWKRVEKLISLLGIEEYADVKLNRLSTGIIQKYNLARGLINDPKVLFLDEPTLGLDVEAARSIRKLIKEWIKSDRKRTILLTTHYMAEAEELCDRIAIIHRGEIVALGSSEELKQKVSRYVIYKIGIRGHARIDFVKEVDGVEAVSYKEDIARGVTVARIVLTEGDYISSVIEKIESSELQIIELSKVEPTLEDVFLKIVGASLEK